MKNLNKAEIFAVGTWNGIPVTMEMLTELANNFTRLRDIVDVPLKIGHNDEQPMKAEDGEMSLGWIDRVWVEGDKLFAKFTDMPDIIHEAIEKKRFKNVSIEAMFDVEHSGVQYGTVLTAVALLGVDMPAVNTLADLTTYMTKKNLAFSSHATFSKKPFNKSEESTMTPEEQAEFDAMKAQLKAQGKTIETNASEAAEFKKSSAEKDEKIKGFETSDKASKFAAEKTAITTDLETLVKENKITPAQRDDLTKNLTEDTIGNVQFTINTLKGNSKVEGKKEQGKQGTNEDNSELPADEQVSIKASEFAAANKVSFGNAVQHVLKVNPKLAREYANLHDEVA